MPESSSTRSRHLKRNRRAESERRVSLRPAPDTMAYLTALVPMAQGVAAYAALTRAAETAKSGGDPRGIGQLMADLLVTRTTGLSDTGTPAQAPAVPVTLNLTLPSSALAGGHETGVITARGVAGEVIPAECARLLAAHALTADVGAWFRQLYAGPTGKLVAMTSRQRCFPDGLAELLEIQGMGICATPWCDAPIRHLDHIVAYDVGGPTSRDNGQGLCAACNHAKQAGWRQAVEAERSVVVTTTTTGHRYPARPPSLPGGSPSPPSRPRVQIGWADVTYRWAA